MRRKISYTRENTNPDAAVLKQLRRFGSDMSKHHHIDFFLYFPAQQKAEIAGRELAALGFSVEVCQSGKGANWLCLASREMVPELEELARLRRILFGLASRLGGEYDGWETQVMNNIPGTD